MTANPHIFLQTAYQHVFTNLSLVSYATVCLYQSLKENCVNAIELPFNTLRNFVCCLAIYHLCSRIFFGWTKLRRKIALCSSELSLDMSWNFMRTFVEKSQEKRTKFAHFACITFAQYFIVWKRRKTRSTSVFLSETISHDGNFQYMVATIKLWWHNINIL